jgi:hypothetical protein
MATPAIAETWVNTGIAAPNAMSVLIDADAIHRSDRDRNRISYRLRLDSSGVATSVRISGSCSTGNWRVGKNNKRENLLITLPENVGDQSLKYACSMAPSPVRSRPLRSGNRRQKSQESKVRKSGE